MTQTLNIQLDRPSTVLDLTPWQLEKLIELTFILSEVLDATEEKLKEANYVGDVRARRMRNACCRSCIRVFVRLKYFTVEFKGAHLVCPYEKIIK
ncbi:MAG: hypothetical protein ACLR17_00325 [Enterobacteriaceae bacterium]